MTTDAQNKANKSNSEHSTGPTSAKGLAISSQNARKHGANAKHLVDADEIAQYDQMITEINGAIKKSECLGADVPAILTVGDADLIREFLKSRFGEELWVYCSPKESWQQLGGRMGLVLMHKNQVVAQTTLMMN